MTLIIKEGLDPKTNAKGPGGRPDGFTADLQEKILAAVRSHQQPNVAIHLAGGTMKMFYDVLKAGGRARDKIDAGGKVTSLTAYEKKCLLFCENYVRAEAYADAVATRVITQASTNVQVTERVATKCIGKDSENNPIMVTETTVTRAPGDWRAMAWWQEHRPFTPYGKRTKVEVSGPDGGPVAMEFALRMAEVEDMIKQAAISVESTEVE